MPQQPFHRVLEAVEDLSDEEQADLISVVQRRLAERGRNRIIEHAQEARRALDAGQCKPATVDEIMREAQS